MKGRRNQTPHTLIWFGSLVLVSVVSTALVAFIWTNLSSAKQDVVVREKFDCVPSDFSTASKESYGLLNDINDQSWRRMKERVKNRKNHKHPEEPWTSSVEPNQWYQDNVRPLLYPPFSNTKMLPNFFNISVLLFFSTFSGSQTFPVRMRDG